MGHVAKKELLGKRVKISAELPGFWSNPFITTPVTVAVGMLLASFWFKGGVYLMLTPGVMLWGLGTLVLATTHYKHGNERIHMHWYLNIAVLAWFGVVVLMGLFAAPAAGPAIGACSPASIAYTGTCRLRTDGALSRPFTVAPNERHAAGGMRLCFADGLANDTIHGYYWRIRVNPYRMSALYHGKPPRTITVRYRLASNEAQCRAMKF